MSYYQVLKVLSNESSDFNTVVRNAEVELCGKISVVSLLLYHILTTLDTEVKYFWKVPLRPTGIVYFMIRYAGLVSICIGIRLVHFLNVPEARCTTITWIHSILDWGVVLLIDYVLTIRVLALYCQDRRLSFILHALLIIEASVRLACMILAVVAEVDMQRQLLAVSACIEQSKCSRRELETLYWIVPAVYQLIIATLACYKAAGYWRLSGGFDGFTLVNVLISDQISYIGLVILVSVTNILKCHMQGDTSFHGIVTVLGSPGLLCLVGSVMLVNLKEAGEKGQNEGTRYRVPNTTVSDMFFA